MGVEGEYYEGPCKLLELPHYVLDTLFSYVDSTSLYHLSQTCTYLKDYIEDPSYWRYIDARDEPNTHNKLKYCIDRVHKRTTHLLLKGHRYLFELPLNFFEKIRPFNNIRVLALENLKLQGSKVALKDFPCGLEELSLRRTFVKNSTYFFQHSVKNLTKLRVLVLDECSWVTCSFLLSVSKYEHLEIISIVKCLGAHLTMIPYLNVARFGCKKLKIFDCRFTGIGAELLRTFYSKESLQRLYFQSLKSAESDYGVKIIDDARYGDNNYPPPDPNTSLSITDIHLRDYASTSAKPADQVEKVCDSLLYRDPYPDCSCGSLKPKEESYPLMESYDDDTVNIPSGRGEPKFVCSKHMKDIVNLPSNFRDFFLSQQRQFNPASGAHCDSDSNSDDEENGGCCYFGMGSSMIMPSTPDRTPSRGEEMTLPREGARNQIPPRVFILNPSRGGGEGTSGTRNSDGSGSSHNNTGRTTNPRSGSPKPGSSKSATKRKLSNSDSGSDSDTGQNKRSRKKEHSNSDGPAQAMLFNQLVESADDVSSRIERIMEENGMSPPNRFPGERKTLNEKNLTPPPPSRTASKSTQTCTESPSDSDNRPSCSKTETNAEQTSESEPTDSDSSARTRISSMNFNCRSGSSCSSLPGTSSGSNSSDSPANTRKKLLAQQQRSDRIARGNALLRELLNAPPKQLPNPKPSTSKPPPHIVECNSLRCSLLFYPRDSQDARDHNRICPAVRFEMEANAARMTTADSSTQTTAEDERASRALGNASGSNDDDDGSSSSDSEAPSRDGRSPRRKKKKNPPADAGRRPQDRMPDRLPASDPFLRILAAPDPRRYWLLEDEDRGRQKKLSLRRLSLRGYRRVTDLTLTFIANLEIELIDLTGTSVTKQGIENFLVHNPNCRVIHALYCTCKPKNPFL